MEGIIDTIGVYLVQLETKMFLLEKRVFELEAKLTAANNPPPIGCDADAHMHSLDKLRNGEGC